MRVESFIRARWKYAKPLFTECLTKLEHYYLLTYLLAGNLNSKIQDTHLGAFASGSVMFAQLWRISLDVAHYVDVFRSAGRFGLTRGRQRVTTVRLGKVLLGLESGDLLGRLGGSIGGRRGRARRGRLLAGSRRTPAGWRLGLVRRSCCGGRGRGRGGGSRHHPAQGRRSQLAGIIVHSAHLAGGGEGVSRSWLSAAVGRLLDPLITEAADDSCF